MTALTKTLERGGVDPNTHKRLKRRGHLDPSGGYPKRSFKRYSSAKRTWLLRRKESPVSGSTSGWTFSRISAGTCSMYST